MYAQVAIKPNPLLRNGAYGIVMRGVQKCTRGCSSLRGRNKLPLCCIKLDTATDPCMGSGHILVYAFDVLMQMYEDAGYSQRDAAQNILENNLYGLDIDDRAYQLAYFAVMMKARQYNRRILNGETTCHVYAIQESNNINRAHLKYLGAGMDELEANTARVQLEGLLDTLRDAKEYGSILKVESYNWELLRRFVSAADAGGQVTLDSAGLEATMEQLEAFIDIAETIAQKYDVVISNPPYLSISVCDANLDKYVKKHYFSTKTDLFAVFIVKCEEMTKLSGIYSMITMHSWMFLSSYEQLRRTLMAVNMINMVHLGAHAFEEIGGEVVQTTSFVIRKIHSREYKGIYCRLVDGASQDEKERMYLSGDERYISRTSGFSNIPGAPIAYSFSESIINIYANSPQLKDVAITRLGMTTANNELFVRLWHEVDQYRCIINANNQEAVNQSGCKWVPYNKGGYFRKWYGNMDCIVNWENEGWQIKHYGETEGHIRSTVPNTEYYFRECGTWSKVSSGNFAMRYRPCGSIFDVAGACLFTTKNNLFLLIGLMNSIVTKHLLSTLSPTMNFEGGQIATLPVAEVNTDTSTDIELLVRDNIRISKSDWDSFETSWDFQQHPLVRPVSTVADASAQWEAECNDRFNKLKANEEELDRIFIDIYGLQDELTPEVEDKDVTVRKADLQRDIKSLLSYAVGCMFGRYSLDMEGLAYAGGDWDESKYKTFLPDVDGILPITDEEYLGDDIVTRLCSWLKVVYGENTLEENLDFIAKALGGTGNSSREIVRKYFLKDFFKDHCKTYQKRPIYWLFDSGKQNGFKALIYLHRYTPDTIGNLRVDYLHKMQRVYESEIGRMQDMIDHSTNAHEVAASTKRKEKLQKQLKECRDYDEMIAHLALSRIELDLDDGVKVNYRKIQTAADGKFYEVLADSKSIMAKEK